LLAVDVPIMKHFPFISFTKRKEFLAILLCLIVGFALRSYTFDKKSLWIDEIHTYNDSRDDLRGQIRFYKENPPYLHPPLFFVMTHLFYPFTKPERDLRIIPLIFGTLSIPMIYLLARLFSPTIALPCTLSLTFMAYHVSLSQDGRSYAMLLFLGISGLYFFMKHLKTLKKRFLPPAAFLFATLLYTSYSSIPFIVFSQILWFYGLHEEKKKPPLSSFSIFNGLLLLFCLPWLVFLLLNYKGGGLMDPFQQKVLISFWEMLYGVLNDWVPHAPLMVASVILLILFVYLTEYRMNALILLSVFIFPIGALYLFCKWFNVNHFITSRYFINFLPPFFISLYLSLDAIKTKFEKLKRFIRLDLLFLFLFIASNLMILPLYYRSEKEDFRGLVNYLEANLREGDKLFDASSMDYIPGILFYFGVIPEGRHYTIPFFKASTGEVQLRKSFFYQNETFTIYHSNTCCSQYLVDGGRLWVIGGSRTANEIKGRSPFVLKGYFDGSFLNFNRFPTDASIYLFLLDPSSPHEKGIDMPIE
jgi:hypothetical protein